MVQRRMSEGPQTTLLLDNEVPYDYADEEPTSEREFLVFIARR